ncbi:MAG: carboxymuconolactone decarboxylase family protein [Sphingomonadaceae bacterium]|nr:carboxymuconolactone decarboxylase family protein [Sphingomonadaceae bacterium]
MSRIPPLEKPYPEAFAAAMARTMPPGADPLVLFTTIATSPRAWEKFSAGSLLDRGPLSLRDREIVIDRTTARTGCEYEWGIHVQAFGPKAGLTPAQIASTVHGTAFDGNWTDAEAALIATVDALLDRKKLTDAEHADLARHYDAAQRLEIVQLIAFYHGVALICGAFDLANEPGTPRFPA